MDENYEQEDDTGIIKPLSAYHHFNRLNSAAIKDEMIKDGKDTALGAVVAVVAAKWKTLSELEKSKYERMAYEDKQRYEKECEIRDEEALCLQEERRKAHEYIETETKMRGSTIKYTESSNTKFNAPKRKRELSEKEIMANEAKKLEKEADSNAMKVQQDELKKKKAEQAEARLKFLLAQSDIFSHFGGAKTGTSSSKAAALSTDTTTASAKGRRARFSASAAEELDEDEKAIIADEEEEATDESKARQSATVLNKQPKCIVGGQMRSYQIEGLNWMIRLQENGINGILADEMGLGKTLQSISVLGYIQEYQNNSGPHLIMVPKSTLSNWIKEFNQWCPSLRTLRFHGSKEERAELTQLHLKPNKYHHERDWDVLVTTYEIVNLEKSVLSKIAWNYLIIDEAHRLKNEASMFSQTVRLLQTQHRLLLTGTPLQNNLHELWALLNFLLPDVFASSEQFDDWFNLDVDDTEAKQRIISQLHKLLRPFMLRRLKIDVEKSLPPKTETILFTGLSTIQKQLYKQILLRDIDTLNSTTNSSNSGSRTAVLNIVMQLRKCCNHPYLFPGVEDRTEDPLGDHLYLSCGKMVLLDKLLRKMKERGHRVLIFSQMTRMLDIMEDYLVSKGYLYCRIDGNTSYEDREDRIYDFNRPGSDKFIFILSTRAGGLGINLQTADTVILYDSDWNPQADLQAQDRAHRIGQKRPVQVFRLVTDDTVEVKVVERAQQKLKLDAMVVQQGRLQEKEKKLSKQDLLDTIRFGADKVFRSKESAITDADIDMILEEGRKRTEEMNEKLQTAEKGDIYDFRLDGGMSTQVFEGKDYSGRNAAQPQILFIDPGKRERKAIASYSETIARLAVTDETDKRQKLPRHLRLNKMEDWQFYDRDRLNALQNEEIRLFDQLVERGEAPQSGAIAKFVVLPPELQEEKMRLISEAFSEWTKVHFNNFVRAAAKHGRNEFEKIAKDVGRPIDEVKRYSKTFWERGSVLLTPADWDRVSKQIEKGEKRLEEISRLTSATAKLIMMFDDPWEELTFRNVGNQGRIFNAVEDRFLLCLTHLHGYGSWDQVRNSVRRCERFRFDFYLQSCSAETLGKRCELLMRSAERELQEIERKKSITMNQSSYSTGSQSKTKTTAEISKERLLDLTRQIAEESRRLANTRAQLQKLKGSGAPTQSSTTTSNTSSIKGFLDGSSARDMLPPQGTKKPSTKNASSTESGRVTLTVPEGLYPELCKALKAAGPDGIQKVVVPFTTRHQELSKRQVEIAISELAYKEKTAGDSYKVWHIKPQYEKYLQMENFDSTKVSYLEPVTTSSSSTGTPSTPTPSTSAKKASTDDKKRKLEETTGSSNKATPTTGGSGTKEPKKYKRAFGFFVKEKRHEAEKELQKQGSGDVDAVKNLLLKMYEELDGETRKYYLKKESEDKARYEVELAAWEKKKDETTSSNVVSLPKKMKA